MLPEEEKLLEIIRRKIGSVESNVCFGTGSTSIPGSPIYYHRIKEGNLMIDVHWWIPYMGARAEAVRLKTYQCGGLFKRMLLDVQLNYNPKKSDFVKSLEDIIEQTRGGKIYVEGLQQSLKINEG